MLRRTSIPRRPPFWASAALAFVAGCTVLGGGTSKVKSGELYETGEARYDAYFKDVHDLQVTAVSWADERKAACRPLVDVLRLPPDAADVSLVQETHERVKAVSRDVGAVKLEVSGDEVALTATDSSKVDEPTREFFKSIELCAHAEVGRARALHDVPPKVDALVKTGRELEPHVREDFAKHGGRIPGEVQSEISASYEVLGDVSRQARSGARQAEDFVSDLQRAVGDVPVAEEPAKPEPKGRKHGGAEAKPAPKPAPKPETKPEPKPETKPEPKPAASSEPPPAPKPKPKPKPQSSEVFNP